MTRTRRSGETKYGWPCKLCLWMRNGSALFERPTAGTCVVVTVSFARDVGIESGRAH
jgi:hypothetical protein